jgi:hypothetical protein
MEFTQCDLLRGRIYKVIDSRSGNKHTIDKEQGSDEEPDFDLTGRLHCSPHYQKMILTAMRTQNTTPAQKFGCLYHGVGPSSGIFVSP